MSRRNKHDEIYKSFFSEPVMVKDLLLNIFGEDWVKELDFNTLEMLNNEHITEDLLKRSNDILWRIRWKDDYLYLVLLIEFQSSDDPFIVVRILSYICLIYLSLIKQDKTIQKSNVLPPMLPMVIYNGESRWKAPVSFNQLFYKELPEKLKQFQPSFCYWLLDEQRYIIKNKGKNKRSLEGYVASLIQLEQCSQPADLKEVVEHLVELFKDAPGYSSLKRAFVVYLKRSLKAKKILPDVDVSQLEEIRVMLSERVEQWYKEARDKGLKDGRQEGLLEGRQEGLEEGLQKGEYLLLRRLLVKKFGALSAKQQNYLKGLSSDALLDLSERVLEASSLKDIFPD